MKFVVRLFCFVTLLSSLSIAQMENKKEIENFLLNLRQDLFDRSNEGKYSRYKIKEYEKEFEFLSVVAMQLYEERHNLKKDAVLDVEVAIKATFYYEGEEHKNKNVICKYLEDEKQANIPGNSIISQYFSCTPKKDPLDNLKRLEEIFIGHVESAYTALSAAHAKTLVSKESTECCIIL